MEKRSDPRLRLLAVWCILQGRKDKAHGITMAGIDLMLQSKYGIVASEKVILGDIRALIKAKYPLQYTPAKRSRVYWTD